MQCQRCRNNALVQVPMKDGTNEWLCRGCAAAVYKDDLAEIVVIQRQRQGVSSTYLRQFFLPCPHGHEWHWQRQGTRSEVSYPNCHVCWGTKWGQTAWSKQHQNEKRGHTEARKVIKQLTGVTVELSKDVEHYMYDNAANLRIWPYLADDVYVAACVYEAGSNTIRHVPTNICLIAFGETLDDAVFDMDAANEPYRELAKKAYKEFCKEHNQRDSERDNRGWLAWILSEYIKGECEGQKPQKMSDIVYEGDVAWHVAATRRSPRRHSGKTV